MIGNFATRLTAVPDAFVGGQTLNALSGNVYSQASQILTETVFEHAALVAPERLFFTTNNVALAASWFRELGGFDASFPRAAAEDREFCDRWRSAGLPLLYAPDAIVYHSHHLTLASFTRQHFNYGRGLLRYNRIGRRRGRGLSVFGPVVDSGLRTRRATGP